MTTSAQSSAQSPADLLRHAQDDRLGSERRVKLLFDLNLSPSLVDWLDDLYPESAHVYTVGLQRLGDDAVWRYAGDHGYMLVTTDTDFDDMSLLLGQPPKIVRVRREKTTTRMLVDMLRRHYADIQALEADAEARVLLLA